MARSLGAKQVGVLLEFCEILGKDGDGHAEVISMELQGVLEAFG